MPSSSSRIPSEWEYNAPHFDSQKPESLLQFLDYMEVLMAKALVPKDELKDTLVRYADYDAKQEWMSLPSFKDGSYDNFVKDILASYPSISDIESGSLALWNKSLERFAPREITMDNQGMLFDLIRTLQAQVKHLVPGKMSSNEAIVAFLGKLDADFVNGIWNRLDMEEVIQSTLPKESLEASVDSDVEKRKRNEIEYYSFDMVVSVAKEIAQNIVDRNEYNLKHCILYTGKVNKHSLDSEMDAVSLYLERKYQATMVELEARKVLMLEQFELHQRQMEQFMMMVMKDYSIPIQEKIPGSVMTENTILVKDAYNIGTDMAEFLFPNGPDYDPRDDEILTLKVSEAKLRQQLALLSKKGTMVQPIPGQSTGVVQPTSVITASQMNALMQAVNSLALWVQETLDSKIESGSNPFRTGISLPAIEEEDFYETDSYMDSSSDGSVSSKGRGKMRKRRPRRRTAHY
ncbi:hypothetical protein C8R44DRAFT_733162 [Mycena epipterygia]|nr:hypothetical protein C8R44DRAFT_733162 [Mycena epipterygia]